jgi:fluoroacetyl-CoA thioesterase
MPLSPPPIGSTCSASLVVSENDLASTLTGAPGEAYPAVFATTRMIALMELAAGRALQATLGPGELSVGVVVDVRHTAATLPGAEVTAYAKYLGREGKLYKFEVWAEDPGGDVGHGTHCRAVVSTARLLEGAKKRGGPGRG